MLKFNKINRKSKKCVKNFQKNSKIVYKILYKRCIKLYIIIVNGQKVSLSSWDIKFPRL